MRFGNLKYYIIIFFSILVSCEPQAEKQVVQQQETARDLYTSPYTLRIKEYEKGNLITNPGFELGRNYIADTLTLSFNLPGWKKVGDNVFWTHTGDKGDYAPNEASQGIHAIKIERSSSNETDHQGEGIISDYIKVIPGNYLLKMDVKLENIDSNQKRFGTGIYDAVNIRMFYYDKNKVLIRKTDFHPGISAEIDPSFKAFGFSGNTDIEKFGWSGIIARAGNFPYEEGNMPEGTKYIRIFAGLKGEGLMWLDHVRFFYTKKNFSFLEQVQPYFDTTLERSVYLIPSPQKVEYPAKLKLVENDGNGKEYFPLFIIPGNLSAEEKTLFNNFKSKLIKSGVIPEKGNYFLNKLPSSGINSSGLIFSFGNSALSREFSGNFPDLNTAQLSQAYYIRRLMDFPRYIFIDYSDNEGLTHAFHTLEQLLDARDGNYYHYDITDFPDYKKRTLILPGESSDGYPVSQALFLFSDYGINKFAAELDAENLEAAEFSRINRQWNEYFTRLRKTFPEIKNGLYFTDLPLNESNELFRLSAKPELEKLKKSILKDANDLSELFGIRKLTLPEFIIFSDRCLWDIFAEEGISRIPLSDYYNYVDMEAGYWKSFFEKSPESEIYLNPVYSSNQDLISESGLSDYYFSKINTTGFDKLLWSGPVKYPELIDASDLMLFPAYKNGICFFNRKFSTRKESFITGSYYSLYPWRIRTGSLFDGLDIAFEDMKPSGFSYEMLLGVENLTELNIIRLLSSIDYLWNISDYDPVLSAWKVLRNLFGEKIARELILFNDAYYKLYAAQVEMETSGYSSRLDKEGETAIEFINLHWEQITLDLASHLSLLNELSDLKNNMISRFYHTRRTNLKQ